ncbi:MAG: hypothetical protein J3R72DRAFT_191498 [Linnemannia gamsii]|nr:MAG: hypothetical protein J3R72DRAFT_191498 [Linnemannia gamsii]
MVMYIDKTRRRESFLDCHSRENNERKQEQAFLLLLSRLLLCCTSSLLCLFHKCVCLYIIALWPRIHSYFLFVPSQRDDPLRLDSIGLLSPSFSLSLQYSLSIPSSPLHSPILHLHLSILTIRSRSKMGALEIPLLPHTATSYNPPLHIPFITPQKKSPRADSLFVQTQLTQQQQNKQQTTVNNSKQQQQ